MYMCIYIYMYVCMDSGRGVFCQPPQESQQGSFGQVCSGHWALRLSSHLSWVARLIPLLQDKIVQVLNLARHLLHEGKTISQYLRSYCSFSSFTKLLDKAERFWSQLVWQASRSARWNHSRAYSSRNSEALRNPFPQTKEPSSRDSAPRRATRRW